jgi:hypothetical protein
MRWVQVGRAVGPIPSLARQTHHLVHHMRTTHGSSRLFFKFPDEIEDGTVYLPFYV